ncbi:hypothetical protein [Ekhidna sp.]|uniref:hypothetical protein n=1 Tax=Ekhidna sp. TaxID=2608089 RepID=UPI0035185A78
MLKRILSDIDVKEFIGLMLLFAGLVIYVIYEPGTIEPDDTKLIRITLTNNPEFGEDAESGYEYFILNAEGIHRKFIVKYWVLNQQTIDAISKIQTGNELVISIEKSEMNGSHIRSAKSKIQVLALKQLNKDWVYSLSNYNKGKVDRWKEYLGYGLFFGILLLPSLIKKIWRIIKNEPEIVTKLKSTENDYG